MMQQGQAEFDELQQKKMPQKVKYEQFIMHYEDNFLYPIIFTIMKSTILIFCLYFVLKIFVVRNDLQMHEEYEKGYIKNLQYIFEEQEVQNLKNKKLFLNLFRQIHNIGIQGYETLTNCDEQRYFCEYTTYSNLQTVINPKYKLVQTTFKNFIQSNQNVKSVFYVEDNEAVFYRFQNLQIVNNTQSILNYVKGQILNSYIMQIVKVYDQVYHLSCSKTDLGGSVCIVQNCFSVKIPNTNNYAYMFNFDKVIKGDPEQGVQQKIKTIVSEWISNDKFDFQINSTTLKSCIQFYYNTKDCHQNSVHKCQIAPYTNLLLPKIVYVRSQIELLPQYYRDSFYEYDYDQTLSMEYFILPNTTYFENQLQYIQMTIQHVQITFKAMVIISLIVCILSVLSEKQIKQKIYPAMMAIINLCQEIKELKNYKEKDIKNIIQNFQNNTHSYIQPFSSTSLHLKYFYWYHEWIKENKLNKKIQLLDQGLKLFNTVDFGPVLIYIYKKKVQISERNLKNIKKFLKVPTSNFNQSLKHNPLFSVSNDKNSLQNIEQQQQQNFCLFVQNQQPKITQYLLDMEKISQKGVRFSCNTNVLDDNKEFLMKNLALSSQSSIIRHSIQSIQSSLEKKKESENTEHNNNNNNIPNISNISNFIRKSGFFKHESINSINFKFDDRTNSEIQKLNEQLEQESYEYMKLSNRKLYEKLREQYELIGEYYSNMIRVKKIQLQTQQAIQIQQSVKDLYMMEIQSLKYVYKLMKFKAKEKNKQLQLYSSKLISYKDIEKTQKVIGKTETKKSISNKINQIQKQFYDHAHNIDIEFKSFRDLQNNFEIQENLQEKASLYHIKLLKVFNYPISYKELQSLCSSSNEEIRTQAKYIMAKEFQALAPHSDLQIINRIKDILLENSTSHVQKRKMLGLISNVLDGVPCMENQLRQISLITNFFNYKQKKLYFLVDFSDSFQVFLPVITKFYDCMQKIDIYQIFNLSMNECMQDMVFGNQSLRPLSLKQFEGKFHIIQNQTSRSKMKIGNRSCKKMSYEKDFNRILSSIEAEQHKYSKYLVIFLGGENEMHSRTSGDIQTSSIQNRQIYQLVHQEIINKMQHNYFHNILIGFNLRDYQTKQGRLKKHVKHCHDLLQMDLVNGHTKQHLYELQKFLKNK